MATTLEIGNAQILGSSGSDDVMWQVFFLPKEDVSFTAFCPFTKITAQGYSINEAARLWTKQAKKIYNLSFNIPKYMLTNRKVWYGEYSQISGGDSSIPLYLIDFNFLHKVVGFCPNTKTIIESISNREAFEELPSKLINNNNNLVNGSVMWMDWKVNCTPVMHCRNANDKFHRDSLTPHCIN